ncbi:hypothetical protein BV20DRAFT_25069 [Pilatotrama ljubarskyi]|nr:hypothetical protein BV20DRAFT_25069 [Pilatotrama ljubarskyi]
MTSQLLSSSLPPTFQEDGEPAQFLDWMQGQMTDLLDDPQLVLKDKRPEWVKTVSSLLTVLSLPSPVELPWTAMHEQIKFIEVALMLIYHAARRVPSLFAGETILAQALFCTVSILCSTLDLWIDIDVPPEDGYLSPSELYAKATSSASALLQALADEVLPDAGPSAREVIRALLSRSLELVNNLMCSENTELPLTVEICNSPEVSQYLNSLSKRSQINVVSISQLPLVTSSILQICCAALTSSMANRWFLTDIVRDAAQVTLRVHDYMLFSCVTPGFTRLRALARTCGAMLAFATTYGFDPVASSCWTRLLLYRIERGPDDEWEQTDRQLTASLRSSSGFSLSNSADFLSLLAALQERDDMSESLRVRTSASTQRRNSPLVSHRSFVEHISSVTYPL